MPFVKGHIPVNKLLNRPQKPCNTCKNPFRMRPGDSYSQWEARQFCSYKCRAKQVATFVKGHRINNGRIQTEEHRRKVGAAQKGEKSHYWKGGITPINQQIRSSFEMKEWRKKVFARDDYRCLDCGERGVYLQADHIFPFAYFPRLRFELENGRTLCRECHRKNPTYGEKAKMLYERIQ